MLPLYPASISATFFLSIQLPLGVDSPASISATFFSSIQLLLRVESTFSSEISDVVDYFEGTYMYSGRLRRLRRAELLFDHSICSRRKYTKTAQP